MICLTVDFGSTYTKLTAIDTINAQVLGTASAFTTIETDVMDGFNVALSNLESRMPNFKYDDLLCCSSAAGGLKMVALGLVPELTAKAAKMAASSAGAKVVRTYSYEISKAEQDDIYEIDPDLVLLCGGTNGGNKDVIIANAKRICAIDRDFSVIVAGNKSASYELDDVFKNSGKDYVITKNVMPSFNVLDIEPAKKCIKDLFIRKIIDAKGLSQVQTMTTHEIVPTPLAVLTGCELFSKGTKHTPGIGDFMAIDLGGATTDVYSMSKGVPSFNNAVIKGFAEPFSKRTVEGDLGMRYCLQSLLEETDTESMAQEIGVEESEILDWVNRCKSDPDIIAPDGSKELLIEEALARRAIEVAVERHCGVIEKVYTPMGEMVAITGKDLSDIPYVVGIGGAIINSHNPEYILEGVKYTPKTLNRMKPKQPRYMLDKKYIFASMGLLSLIDAELALKMMLKEIIIIQ